MADKDVEQPVYTPTTAQLDRERRLDDADLTPEELAEKYGTEARDFTGDGNDTSLFVGVNPEYQNYAGVFNQPFRAEDGAERELEDELTQGGATAPKVEFDSNQTDGGGSTIPLVYAELSGDDFTNREVSQKEADAERDRLDPETEVKPAPKTEPVAAPKKVAASGKTSNN